MSVSSSSWVSAETGTQKTDTVDAGEIVRQLEALYKLGRNAELLAVANALPELSDRSAQLRIRVLVGMARFDLGDVVSSISDLRRASADSGCAGIQVQFSTAFAHFLRASDFLDSDSLIPHLTNLRQLATRVGDAESLASLHLAVARVEGFRGHFLTSHHHLELARSLASRSTNVSLQLTVDLVDASLQSLAGNLQRAEHLASASLEKSRGAGFMKYEIAALTNLAVVALNSDRLERAHLLLDRVLQSTESFTYVRLGALDTLAQLLLRSTNLSDCSRVLTQCTDAIAKDSLPARSWYDLAHQVTRCAYFERLREWSVVLEVVETTDTEVTRRHYKTVRIALLCAKARALARMGRQDEASAALAVAVRTCPRGAVDPLIVLEASKALCASLRGATTTGRVHYERATAACRAIGHRYHEWWIGEQRDEVLQKAQTVPVGSCQQLDMTQASMLLNDVATALGAGHSIDLLSHRIAAILHSTTLGKRVEIASESGLEYRPVPSVEVDTTHDGTCAIRLMGSDRLAVLTIRGAQSIEEVTLVRGLIDLVQMAVARTRDTEREDEDLTLWPRAVDHIGEDAIFRSPRMIELVRIAERLAATSLPVLITGETGTGKEVFARLIHEHSAQKRGPFVPFNCSAVTRELVESQLFGHRRGAFTGAIDAFPGVIRAAERGTLFLDEIGDLESAVQPKLLRFLESGEIQPVGDTRPQRVTVRLVAATNSNLDALTRDGRFRPDLFYRIGGAHLELPPLRERKDEIPALASLFLARYASECGRSGLRLADDFIAALLLYDWPGNIRQLSNEIRRIAAMATDGAVIGARELAPDIVANWNARPTLQPRASSPSVEVRLDQPLAKAIDDLERKFIEHALAASNGRVTDAAQLLGLSRKGLFLKRRRCGLVGGADSLN